MNAIGHNSTPAPLQQPPHTLGRNSHNGNTHMSMTMPMTFYFGYKKVELFAGLVIDSVGAMPGAFLALFLLAVVYEGLTRSFCTRPRIYLSQNQQEPKKSRSACQQLLSCDLQVQMTLPCAPNAP